MKKLMEDIASVFCPNCVGYDVPGEQCGRGRKVLECENATGPARYAIICIGKAVLSGEYPQLDKLLAVVGRCKAALGEFTPLMNWAHGIWKEGLLTTEHETTTFIAFRPPGTESEDEG